MGGSLLARTSCRSIPCAAGGEAGRAANDAALLLAFRAEEGGPSGMAHAPDRAVTTRLQTFLPLAVIDAETMLKIAERPVGVDEIAQRGSAGRDRLANDTADCLSQRGGVPADPPGGAIRRQAGAPQCLAHIDI